MTNRLADFDKAWADVEKAKAEVEKAQTLRARRQAEYERLLKREPRPKRKQGRPGIWRSQLGAAFAFEVEKLCREQKYKIARAITSVLKRSEFHQLKRKGRAPQVRYQTARKYLMEQNPWAEIARNWERETKRAAYDAAAASVGAAIVRWQAAANKARRILEGRK